jgi:hypothetical protein
LYHSWEHSCKDWIPTYKMKTKKILDNVEPLKKKGENLDLDTWPHLYQWNLPLYSLSAVSLPHRCFLPTLSDLLSFYTRLETPCLRCTP